MKREKESQRESQRCNTSDQGRVRESEGEREGGERPSMRDNERERDATRATKEE